MKINRAQLAKFLPDNESIRIFEDLATTATRADDSAGSLLSLPTAVTASNTTLVDSGLLASLASGQTYKFEFFGAYTVASAAVGSRWVIEGPSASVLAYSSEYSLTATSRTINQLSAYSLPAAANASSAGTGGNVVCVQGIVKPSANGTLSMKFASGGASAVNLVAGYLRVIRLT
jgi:hypothetical protein